MSEPFIGEVRMFPYSFPPRNWAYCNGQEFQVEQNEVLFAVIGSAFGGNGYTTFALPNLMARTPVHQGTSPGLSQPYIFSYYFGTDEVTLTEADLPAHSHQASAAQVSATASTPTGAGAAVTTEANAFKSNPDSANYTPMAEEALATTGEGEAHENRQPFLVVPFCIALEGIFPSRN